MNQSTIILDPTAERSETMRARITPPPSLAGLTVGLLDISKPRGDVFLDRLQSRFGEQGIEVRRYTKPTYTKKAPDEIAAAIAEQCDIAVEALAD